MIFIRVCIGLSLVLCIGCSSKERAAHPVHVSKPTLENETETIRVAIPIFKNPQPDAIGPEVYEHMSLYFYQETGKRLEVEHVWLDDLQDFDPALLHLVGSDSVDFELWEKQAIEAYVASGGTTLIENLGGEGGFVMSIRDQFIGVFSGFDDRISSRSDIITGRNLPEGSKSIRRLFYCDAVKQVNPDGVLLLRGWEVNERYPVLLSFEDISLRMIGVNNDEALGHRTESAKDLMLNILLVAERQQKSERY
ncbi:MAG: hypothetical protein AAGB26_08465 [Planctomycetota bacterium]